MSVKCFYISVSLWLCHSCLLADDWPQWRGPNRDGRWREHGIIRSIPTEGLKVRWHARVGRGYSGPVVAGGHVFIMDQVFAPELERLLCLEETSGQMIWTESYPCDYRDMEYGNGPRASPTVHDGNVYTLGTQGVLSCVEARSGKRLWRKDLLKEYQARIPRYGASAAPLIERDLVIVCIGGQPDASVIAFDRITGQERWKALADRPAYSAPMIVDSGGRRQLIVWTADGVHSMEPTTGDEYWNIPWKTTFDEAQVVASPIVLDDRMLFVMAWSRGSMMLHLNAQNPDAAIQWKTRDRPSTMISTPLWMESDCFYTFDNVRGLCCADAASGEEIWSTHEAAGHSNAANAHLTPNEDRVFLFNQRGQLVLARLTRDGYEEFGRSLLVEPTAGHRAQGAVAWAHPAYANKHVYARNDKVLVCASLATDEYLNSSDSDSQPSPPVRVVGSFVGTSSILALDYSPDGQTLVLGTWGGNVRLVNPSTGKEERCNMPKLKNSCSALTISPNGKFLAYAGGSEFKQAGNNRQTSSELIVWDMTAQTPVGHFAGHSNKITCAAFTPDSQTLATGSADRTIRLWDLPAGKTSAVLEGHDDAVWSLAITPDGQTLVSAGWDGGLKFWDISRGEETASIQSHEEEILSLAVSPDGETVATGSADWTIRLWHVKTQKQQGILEGHRGGIYCVSFSSDGKTLATGSGDETVKLWDVKTMRAVKTLAGHQGAVVSLSFSPDDRTLASAGRDDSLRLWDLGAHESL